MVLSYFQLVSKRVHFRNAYAFCSCNARDNATAHSIHIMSVRCCLYAVTKVDRLKYAMIATASYRQPVLTKTHNIEHGLMCGRLCLFWMEQVYNSLLFYLDFGDDDDAISVGSLPGVKYHLLSIHQQH